MALNGLNHVSTRPSDLEATKDFYVQALGLAVGERPTLPFPGYWLYCGKQAVIHLLGTELGAGGDPPATGRLDHIAFEGSGLDEIKARLAKQRIQYEEREIASVNLTQLFLHDPDGVAVEINFPHA
jgi:catechol 2,3-dioxygenase-like lactoylglutathione lyase family enzyme